MIFRFAHSILFVILFCLTFFGVILTLLLRIIFNPFLHEDCGNKVIDFYIKHVLGLPLHVFNLLEDKIWKKDKI